MKHERLRMAHHSNMCSNCGAPLPGGGLCTSCEDRKLKESPEYKIQTLESKLAEAEACIITKNVDLRSILDERERLRKALQVAINTVECASIDPITKEELPWYRQAKEALAPAPEDAK